MDVSNWVRAGGRRSIVFEHSPPSQTPQPNHGLKTPQGNYIQQTKQPLPHESSAPIKTFEGHRFFVAFAKEAHKVPSWDPDAIPEYAQFVHRGFDQVVTAKVYCMYRNVYGGGSTRWISCMHGHPHTNTDA